MMTMKAADLRIKTITELYTELTKLKKEGMNLRFQKVTGELKNLSRSRVVRRTVALIKTLINEKKSKGEK